MTLDLDVITARLQDGDVEAGLYELNAGLGRARREHDATCWKQFVEDARRHPVCQLLHQDPFTRRSFQRPRGYPGDAVLLDMIYRQRPDEPAFSFGEQVFSVTIASPAPSAVRARKQAIAGRLATLDSTAEVLSVAAGHLREYEQFCDQPGRFRRFVALDQDELSLAEVASTYGPLGVTTAQQSAVTIDRIAPTLGQFDFVYSAGLFDYFDDRLARRVARTLATLVKPGGTLLLANFVPSIPDAAYMECFMDWWLVYRTAAEVGGLLAPLAAEPGDVLTSYDSTEQVAFAEAVVHGGRHE